MGQSLSRGLIVFTGAAFALAAIGSAKKRGGGGGGGSVPPMPEPLSGGQDDIRYLAEWAFLDEEWTIFLEWVAKGESNFNNLVGLGNPSLFPDWAKANKSMAEAAAAARGYERNSYLKSCGWGASRYTFGSGGWFGLLPASAVAAFKGTRYECIDPWSVFDPVASFVEALDYARRLVSNWSGFKKNPTWQNLRLGWGNPSEMGDPEALARVDGEDLEALGYPVSFMHRQVTPFPGDPSADLLDALMEVL